MGELNLFAEITLKNGGEWWQLEESDGYTLCESKTKFVVNHRVYYNPPVFQVFDRRTGKRLFASTNYFSALEKYRQLTEEDKK